MSEYQDWHDAELPARGADEMSADEGPDMTQPIYAESPESQVVPGQVNYEELNAEEQAKDVDLFDVLHRIENKIDAQAATTDGLRNGVNTIGEMMNAVAETFDQIMKKVQSGGIGALLGGMMGGKNDG